MHVGKCLIKHTCIFFEVNYKEFFKSNAKFLLPDITQKSKRIKLIFYMKTVENVNWTTSVKHDFMSHIKHGSFYNQGVTTLVE